MTYGGLFEGIGGFALAARSAGIEPVWSNEINAKCCTDLRRNFSHQIIEDDIRNIGKKRTHPLSPVDIICGGFPCQPFSIAGARKGRNDNRYLWPEMRRVIQENRPPWVIAENVTGILTMDNGSIFQHVCTDLEAIGYEVQPLIIPAGSIGAPHLRKRVWIIGYSNSKNDRRNSNKIPGQEGKEPLQKWKSTQQSGIPIFSHHWQEYFALDPGMDDGIPPWMGNRWNHEIACFGNAIVPGIAEIILSSIRAIHEPDHGLIVRSVKI